MEQNWKLPGCPYKGLELSAGLNVMQAKYDNYDLGTFTLDGEHMEGAPNHTLCLTAVYHHPGGLYGRADVRNVGNIYYYDASAQILQEAVYTNLRLGWLYRNWDIYAFAHNLTDEEYINASKSTSMTGGIIGFGDCRFIGVGLSYSF